MRSWLRPLAVLAALLTGCAATSQELLSDLKSPDADDRREAAEGLRDQGVPQGGAQELAAAASTERDQATRAAMLRALGASGAPEAWAVLDRARVDPDPEIRAAADEGTEDWLTANGYVWPDVQQSVYADASDGPAFGVYAGTCVGCPGAWDDPLARPRGFGSRPPPARRPALRWHR